MLIDLLSEKEKKLINTLRKIGVNDEDILNRNYVDCDYFLRYWNFNKAPFEDIFKDSLILKKKIHVSVEDQELHDDMWMLIRSNDFQKMIESIGYFLSSFNDIDKKFCTSKGYWTSIWGELRTCLFDTDTLISNKYNGENLEIKISTEKVFKLTKGCKAMKAIGKLAQEAGSSIQEIFENIRIKHSQIMNEANIVANLCLSIHPMDYITASYNNNNWESCMCWEEGEYRRGVIEMMNSPFVIVTYLESDHQDLEFYENGEIELWNSKKWREFIIVSPTGIFGIKGYPYWNRKIEDLALTWVKELLNEVRDNKYSNNICEWETTSEAIIDDSVQSELTVRMKCGPAMYNDFYNENTYHAILAKNVNTSVSIFYSGESECVICGQEADFGDTGCLGCEDCIRINYCSHCGDRVFNDEDIVYLNDRVYCRYCYSSFPVCSCCDEVIDPCTDHLKFCIGSERNNKVVVEDELNSMVKVCCEDCAPEVFIDGVKEIFHPHERFRLNTFSSAPIVPISHIKSFDSLGITDEQLKHFYNRLSYIERSLEDKEKNSA